MAIRLTNGSMQAACDAVTALVNTAGLAKVRLYAEVQEVDPNAGSPVTLLVENVMSATAFGASVINGTNAEATANAIATGAVTAAGTAQSFEMVRGDNSVVWTGTVSTAGADINMSTNVLALAANVDYTSYIFGIKRDP